MRRVGQGPPTRTSGGFHGCGGNTSVLLERLDHQNISQREQASNHRSDTSTRDWLSRQEVVRVQVGIARLYGTCHSGGEGDYNSANPIRVTLMPEKKWRLEVS